MGESHAALDKAIVGAGLSTAATVAMRADAKAFGEGERELPRGRVSYQADRLGREDTDGNMSLTSTFCASH